MHPHLPLSFADDLEHNARWYGKLPAYTQDARVITHAALLARAKQLGAALYAAGARRQDRIGMLAMNSIEYGETIAATQWSGFILATINFRLAAAEMEFIINDGAPRILIFEAQYLPLIAQLRPALRSVEHYICIGADVDIDIDWAVDYKSFVDGGDPDGPPLRAAEDDIACLIYTSGTTGRPKGCIWGHRELRQLVQVDNWLSSMEQSDRGLIVMPMFHIGGLLISLSLHFRGAAVYLQRLFDPAAVLRSIERDRLTFLLLAPTMVQMVLEEAALASTDTSSVRMIMYSAAPMPLTVLKAAISAFGCGFVNLYGQTEICMFALSPGQHLPNGTEKERARLGSVGNPYPNLRAKIIDADGNECATGVPGEIVARSSAMFRGYWNNHPATIETLRDGWCHTGDMGKIDEDGFLFLVDRKKDMIISGGENIYSREVEEAILQHPAVSECAVIGLADVKWGEAVCAVVTLKAGQSASPDQIIAHTKARIASYKKPKRVIIVNSLPKLVTGKINKIALRQEYAM